jgi:enamine deaminase RidA (YjgF/YER057c/UK114 family)
MSGGSDTLHGMSVQAINPDGLMQPQGYAQVAVATGSRLVFLAGQTAQTADGSLVGAGDLAAQVEQILRNVATALQAAGATFADVVKTTIYVVDWHPSKMEALFAGMGRIANELGIEPDRPVTMIGVQALAAPELLVEFDVTAVVE